MQTRHQIGLVLGSFRTALSTEHYFAGSLRLRARYFHVNMLASKKSRSVIEILRKRKQIEAGSWERSVADLGACEQSDIVLASVSVGFDSFERIVVLCDNTKYNMYKQSI